MGIVIGVVIAAAGAILRYATSASVAHLNLRLTGLILMIAGVALAVLSFVALVVRRERIVHITEPAPAPIPGAPAAPVTPVAPVAQPVATPVAEPVVDRPISHRQRPSTVMVDETDGTTAYDRPV